MEKYSLVGVDGNAYAIMGYTARALQMEGLAYLKDKMYKRAMSSDYNHLIVVCLEYIDMANEKALENGFVANYDDDDDWDELEAEEKY